MAMKLDSITGKWIEHEEEDASQSTVNALTAEDIAKLEGMSRDELKALCRRFACQCGLSTMMTKEETAQAMRDVLAETALRPIVLGLNMKADIQSRMTAIDKWLDRTEGKAPISINQNTNITSNISMISKDEINDIIKNWLDNRPMMIEENETSKILA